MRASTQPAAPAETAHRSFKRAKDTNLCNFLAIFKFASAIKCARFKQYTCLSTWLYTRDAHTDSPAFPLFISGLAHWPQQKRQWKCAARNPVTHGTFQ